MLYFQTRLGITFHYFPCIFSRSISNLMNLTSFYDLNLCFNCTCPKAFTRVPSYLQLSIRDIECYFGDANFPSKNYSILPDKTLVFVLENNVLSDVKSYFIGNPILPKKWCTTLRKVFVFWNELSFGLCRRAEEARDSFSNVVCQ